MCFQFLMACSLTVYIDPHLVPYSICLISTLTIVSHCLLDLWSNTDINQTSVSDSRLQETSDSNFRIRLLIDWNRIPYTRTTLSSLILNSTSHSLGYVSVPIKFRTCGRWYRNTGPAASRLGSARAEATVRYPSEPDSRPRVQCITHNNELKPLSETPLKPDVQLSSACTHS